MLNQYINIVDFKVNNKLYEDYDIYQVIRAIDKTKNNIPKCSIRKSLDDVISNIVVIYNHRGLEHYVVVKKDKLNVNDIKSCFDNEPKVKLITYNSNDIENQNIIELNIILLLMSSKREEKGTIIVNYNYDIILKHFKNQIMCLHCRFKKDKNNNCIYLDYGTKKYTKLSVYNDEDKQKIHGPYFLIGSKTMKEIPDKNKFSEDEVYVQANPYGNNTSYNRFEVPHPEKQYIADEFYSCSIFGVIVRDVYNELKESKYIDYFNFKSISVEEYADKKTFEKNKNNILNKIKECVFNFVYPDTEKLSIILSNVKDEEKSLEDTLNIKSYTVSTEPLENCFNIIILDEDSNRSDETNESNIIYKKSKNNLSSNKINQHVVLENGQLTKQQILTSLTELLIKQAIITKDVSLFTLNINENKEYSCYMKTKEEKKKNSYLYHKITINKNKITQLEINKPDWYGFEINERNYFKDDVLCIVDEKGNSIKINNTQYSILPDCSKVKEEIEMLQENNKKSICISFLYDLITDYYMSTRNKNHKQIIEKIFEDFPEINDENNDIKTILEIKKIYEKTSDGKNTKNIFEKIFELYGYQINAHWKAKAFSDETYPCLRDIHYNNEYYTVSYPGSIAKSYPTGILLKHYQYENENIIKDVLAMCNVPFVRNGQLTCYPFPFKFLREARKMDNPEEI